VPIYVPPLRERGKDIELLFRKFATDFAEKYKVKPITLTDEAKNLLLKYRFPGNIRQLKNLVEQISVLSSDNMEITAEVLGNYIPKESSLPALYKDQHNKDNISEREILYKILFDLRKDMNDLKKVVLESTANPAQASQIIKEHAGLFEGIHEAEDDSLSIVKKEKELIQRALRKNNNKRKYAARDLGISERTLYRKIKEYELEE
jgi:DNA-binding NtrC family response regulator